MKAVRSDRSRDAADARTLHYRGVGDLLEGGASLDADLFDQEIHADDNSHRLPHGAAPVSPSDLRAPNSLFRLLVGVLEFSEFGPLKHRIDVPGAQATTVSPAGDVFAVASARDVRIFDLASGRLICSLTAPDNLALVTEMAFSQDGQHLIAWYKNNFARIWNLETGGIEPIWQPTMQINGPNPIFNVAFAGERVVARGHNQIDWYEWDASSKKLEHAGQISKDDLDPDYIIRTMTVSEHKQVAMVRYVKSPMPNTSAVASQVSLWAPDSTKLGEMTEVERLEIRPDVNICKIKYASDGRCLAAGDWQGSVYLIAPQLNVNDPNRIRKLEGGHARAVTDLAFSPNGRMIASASYDGAVRIWDSASGKCLAVLEHQQGEKKVGVNSVCFTPDGLHLLSTSEVGNEVRFWAAVTLEAAGEL